MGARFRCSRVLSRAVLRQNVARRIALVFFSCSFVAAQCDRAAISGRIADQSGAVLVAARVDVTDVETGVSVSTLAGDDGVYVLTNLRPGPYRMTVQKEGFRTIVLSDLVLNVQDALSRNFTMQVGIASETITVTAGLDEQNLSATVSTVVDSQFVQNMPLNGGSFQSLIELAPGVVVTPSTFIRPGQFSVNGQRNNANYFMVDGVSATFGINAYSTGSQAVAGVVPALTSGGGTNSLVSVDAMKEFRIQTSSFAPEYGRMPGSQISIVTRSGTKQWHGTVYDYLRNDAFDARNYFNAPPEPQPALRQNDFGGTLGGPVWKNHIYFFFSYEGLRLLQPNVEDGYFLTPASRANVSPRWAPIVDSLPVPNANAQLSDPSCDNVTVPCSGEIKEGYSDPSGFNAYSLRIDYNLTDKISLFARGSHAPSYQAANSFQELANSVVQTDVVTLGATFTLSPTIVNDFRANWSKQTAFYTTTLDRLHGATIPRQSTLYPPGFNFANVQAYFAISVDGAYQEVRTGTSSWNSQSQWNFVDAFSKINGGHQLKFGLDFRRMMPTTLGRNGSAVFAGGGGPHADGWFALTHGYMDQYLADASNKIAAQIDNWSLFAQDMWQVKPRLTLTYGLRWEINTPPVSDTAGSPLYAVWGVFDSRPFELAPAGTRLWSTQLDAFAPRIGVAFQVEPQTVIRGGFGLFYDLGYDRNIGSIMGGDFPYLRYNFVNGYDSKQDPILPLDFTNPIYRPPPFTTTITANVLSMNVVDPHLRLPVTYEWNAALEHQFGANQSISATYVGANAQKLLWADRIVPPGSIFQTMGTGGFVTAARNAGQAHYNSLQLQFKRRMSHGLQVLAAYTLAKSSDSGTIDAGEISFPTVGVATLPTLSPSDFDIRNSASAAVAYEIPVPKRDGVISAVLRGWAVDGVWHASSGPPLDVLMASSSSVLGYDYLRPALVPGQPVWISDPTQPAGKALNPNAFTLPANGASNDALRNSIRSPYGIDQINLAVRRRFNITESVKLDFRVEYFNLFNHPMFGGSVAPYTFWGFCYSQPCAGLQISEFGKVWPGLSTLNVGLGGGGLNGGQSALYAPGGSRSGQFSLKLSF